MHAIIVNRRNQHDAVFLYPEEHLAAASSDFSLSQKLWLDTEPTDWTRASLVQNVHLIEVEAEVLTPRDFLLALKVAAEQFIEDDPEADDATYTRCLLIRINAALETE